MQATVNDIFFSYCGSQPSSLTRHEVYPESYRKLGILITSYRTSPKNPNTDHNIKTEWRRENSPRTEGPSEQILHICSTSFFPLIGLSGSPRLKKETEIVVQKPNRANVVGFVPTPFYAGDPSNGGADLIRKKSRLQQWSKTNRNTPT